MLYFKIQNEQELVCISKSIISAGTTDVYASFDVGDLYKGPLVAYFNVVGRTGAPFDMEIVDGKCLIPWEVLATSCAEYLPLNEKFPASINHIMIVSIADMERTTSSACRVPVYKTAFSDDVEEPTEPSDTLTQQVLKKVPTKGSIVDNSMKFGNEYNENLFEVDVSGIGGGGSTVGDAELADARVDKNGKIYPNVGDHIRSVTGQLSEQIDDLQNMLGSYSKNRFNAADSRNIIGYYVANDCKKYQYEYTMISHPIKVEQGKTYCFPKLGIMGNNAANIFKCDYDGNVLSKIECTPSEDGTYYIFNCVETSYIVCNVGASATMRGSYMFYIGSEYPAEYVPYEFKYDGELQKELEEMVNSKNVLYGKSIAFDGDSICYGAGYLGGYPKIIGENNSMIVHNAGVAGATITKGTIYTDSGANRHWISESVKTLPTNYDYYIIEGGVNDAWNNGQIEVGEITTDYTSTLDDTTFCGAMESICKTLCETYAGKKVGFIFVHRCFNNNLWEQNYKSNMIKALEKWGVPYLDLEKEVPPLMYIDSLKTVYTKNGDGCHPNELGYNTYYVPKIEAWLKTL